jgi:hypothetical protein
MAFNIDPTISLKVQGPQQYTLPDLMNMATSAQAYRQRQQLNPIEVQSKQIELDNAKITNLNNHFTAIVQNTADLMADPDITTDKIVSRAKQVNQSYGGDEKSLQQYLIGLPMDNDPKKLKAWLAQEQAKVLSAQSQLDKLYPAGILPGQLPNVSTENQPGGPQTQSQPQAAQKGGVSEEQMNKPVHSQPENTPYPVRNPNTPYLPFPTEKADQDEGFKTRNALVQRQSTLTTDRRNIDEVIKAARKLEKEALVIPGTNLESTKGAWGALSRGWANITDSSKYKQLSKDLANVQISNTLAKGGSLDTVQGQQLVKAANGDETFPPDVLINIANRAKADMTELDKKANGAQKFAERFGDNNLKKFQQEWQKNARSEIFELYNIFNDPELTQAEKEKARDRLLPKSAKERKIFQERWNNIQKLEETGSL